MPYCRLLLASLTLYLAVFLAPLRGETPIFFSGGDAAINGYDTVAYFTKGKPVKGKADIAVMWKGVMWQFASKGNRARFEANPRAYAPQYGGYCAYGVANGYRDRSEPDAWQISNGKLYMIRSHYVRAIWNRDVRGYIARADSNWPGVLDD